MRVLSLVTSAVFASYFLILLPLDYMRGIKPESVQVALCQNDSCDPIDTEFQDLFNENYMSSGLFNKDGNRDFCSEVTSMIPSMLSSDAIEILDLFSIRGILDYKISAEIVTVSAGGRVDSIWDVLYNFIGVKMSCYPRYFGYEPMLAVMILYYTFTPILLLIYRRRRANDG